MNFRTLDELWMWCIVGLAVDGVCSGIIAAITLVSLRS